MLLDVVRNLIALVLLLDRLIVSVLLFAAPHKVAALPTDALRRPWFHRRRGAFPAISSGRRGEHGRVSFRPSRLLGAPLTRQAPPVVFLARAAGILPRIRLTGGAPGPRGSIRPAQPGTARGQFCEQWPRTCGQFLSRFGFLLRVSSGFFFFCLVLFRLVFFFF